MNRHKNGRWEVAVAAAILDGKVVAAAVKAEVAEQVRTLGRRPGLATVLVGDDPASHTYVRGKRRDAEEVGMASFHHQLDAGVTQAEVEDLIDKLNEAPEVDGILVQLPLPKGLDSEAVVERIDPRKDVDGLHPTNLGLLLLDRPGPRPCTPSGVMRLLDHYGITPSRKRAVVVGRSFLVGRPLALMLSTKGVDATVTIAHSRTKELSAVTKEADLLIAAVGVAGLITAEHVRPGATVIDVGINRVGGKLVGDVDFDSVVEVAGAITPVPGGVGPMTRAMLLVNTLAAAEGRFLLPPHRFGA
ncbi:MAG: bifunctional methylenetetrahydrofolate dehydrogenase/methenyltetrahydrofolate cyclohydrolase FolD [Acidimicrobiia bacterium]|nr:bifunctional methylenetetrahydrofolate dehydrogenase/methenyltetrahydrofolate cyclohydrolase FolD [Acidimicrobiia bacterium]